MDKYICKVCATIYDPSLGDLEDNIQPGTPFEKLPKTWVCTICGTPQDRFEKISEEEYQKIINKH